MSAAMAWQSFADDNPTNRWGVASCGIQMSLQFVVPVMAVETNQPVNLSILIKNVSNGTINYVETGILKDYYFDITFPSGKMWSTKEPILNNNTAESRSTRQLQPGGSCELQFDFRSICDLTEIGTYKIVAKRNVPFPYRRDCVVVSSQLSLTVVSRR